MPIQEYTIRCVGGLWQVRLGGRLVGSRSTQVEAVNLVECLAQRRPLADRNQGLWSLIPPATTRCGSRRSSWSPSGSEKARRSDRRESGGGGLFTTVAGAADGGSELRR